MSNSRMCKVGPVSIADPFCPYEKTLTGGEAEGEGLVLVVGESSAVNLCLGFLLNSSEKSIPRQPALAAQPEPWIYSLFFCLFSLQQ